MLREHFPALQTWNLQVVASDISNEMLQKARQGLYSQLEVNRGLPATLLVKYFKKEGNDWRLSESIRKMVDFRRINLASPCPRCPRRYHVVAERDDLFSGGDQEADSKKFTPGDAADGYLFLVRRRPPSISMRPIRMRSTKMSATIVCWQERNEGSDVQAGSQFLICRINTFDFHGGRIRLE